MESSCERVRIQRNSRAQEFCITAFQKRQIQAAIFQGCRDMDQPPTVSYSQVSLEDSTDYGAVVVVLRTSTRPLTGLQGSRNYFTRFSCQLVHSDDVVDTPSQFAAYSSSQPRRRAIISEDHSRYPLKLSGLLQHPTGVLKCHNHANHTGPSLALHSSGGIFQGLQETVDRSDCSSQISVQGHAKLRTQDSVHTVLPRAGT